MKRAVITGASGFVGANLIRRLLRDGHDAHLLLRPSSRRWRLEDILDHATIHEAKLEDRERIGRVIREIRPDWVFNLAAYGAYSSQTGFDEMIATNLSGCAAIVDACAETGVEAFIQAGSSSEYGYKDHATSEQEILAPNSHYAITKAAATHYCQLAAATRGLNTTVLRLYSIYGPYEEPTRLIPALITYGKRGEIPPLVSPSTARDMVHVDDAVDAMIKIAANPSLRRGAVYNICSGVQSDIRTIVEVICRLMNISALPTWSNMQPRSWDTDIWVGSPRLMSEEAGWHCQTNLESGLRQTIEWFNANPNWTNSYRNGS